jgi:hypothetical protein
MSVNTKCGCHSGRHPGTAQDFMVISVRALGTESNSGAKGSAYLDADESAVRPDIDGALLFSSMKGPRDFHIHLSAAAGSWPHVRHNASHAGHGLGVNTPWRAHSPSTRGGGRKRRLAEGRSACAAWLQSSPKRWADGSPSHCRAVHPAKPPGGPVCGDDRIRAARRGRQRLRR